MEEEVWSEGEAVTILAIRERPREQRASKGH